MISNQPLDDDPGFDEKIFRVVNKGLIEDFIDRRTAEVPDTFVPSAKYVAVANAHLLYLAHPRLAHYSRWGWVVHERDRLHNAIVGDFFLSVRRYGGEWGYGKTWGIERELLGTKVHEVLAFDFGPTPVVFREVKAAMSLAKNCLPSPREEAKCLRWIPITA